MDPVPAAAAARAAIDRLRDEIPHLPWFASLGAAPSDAETAQALAYLEALDETDWALDWADGWDEAERVARDPAGAAWWRREQVHQKALLDALGILAREPQFIDRLNAAVLAASDHAMGRAAVAAAAAGVTRQAIIRVAAGAASQAFEQAALARAAGAPANHPFLLKLELYAAGRWPLGVAGGAFHMF